jgi:hypothetical protein
MLMPCEECKYYVGNKCWHYGKLNLGQKWEKIVKGCEKDHDRTEPNLFNQFMANGKENDIS